MGIGAELSIDGVGDPAFEAPDGLEGLLAFGALAPVVGQAVGVEADLEIAARPPRFVTCRAVPGTRTTPGSRSS
jgi:hypothetical protein